jgi:hypothetical protein
MCLRFVYLLVVNAFSWMRVARRQGVWKDAAIMLLRHQFVVLQRQQARRPRLTWADRALIATLASVIPRARRVGLRLLVTPDTVVRWHRDLPRRRWAAKSRAGRSGRPCGCRKLHPRWSCCVSVLVEDAAQALPFSDVQMRDLVRFGDRRGEWVEWSGVGDAAVGPVPVVEGFVLA